MKKNVTLPAALVVPVLIVAFMLIACAGTPKFDNVKNNDWDLAQLRIGKENIVIQRHMLAEYGFTEIYTLRFEEGRISGAGAPNRYFAPYTLGDKQAITFGLIASTMMAAFVEPHELKEHDYFVWLQNVYAWNIVKGNLELYSRNDGKEAVLVFTPF
jgi:heat shock protein HslJ